MAELVRLTDAVIFDLEDRFAADRGVRGRHPRPLGTVNFLLVGRFVNNVRVDFKSPIAMIVKSNNSGYHLFFDQVKSEDGYARRVLVDGTRYVVRVESDFYQPVERDDIVWPMPRPVAPYFFDLQPGYAYPFPKDSSLGGGLGATLLRGALLRPGGEGVANARLRVQTPPRFKITDRSIGSLRSEAVPAAVLDKLREKEIHNEEVEGEQTFLDLLKTKIPAAQVEQFKPLILKYAQLQPREFVTDRTGKWVLVFPDTQPTGEITLSVSLTDPAGQFQVPNVPVTPGRETGLSLTALEGRVVNRSGVGISGAVIEIAAQPLKSKTRGNGSWFYYFPLNQPAATVAVTARLPDGGSLTQSNIQVQPRKTTPVAVFQFS